MRGLNEVLLLALIASALIGCVDQRAEVNRYREVLDHDAPFVEALKEGEPLLLSRALLLANQDNENLAIRGEDYVQAIAEKDRAFSTFLPTISLAPSYTIVDNADAPTTNADGTARAVGTSGGFKAVSNTLRRFEAPVNASMNLFRGFRDAASFEAAIAGVEQRRLILLDVRASLLLQVADTYYQVLRFERAVQVLKQSLQAQSERVRDATTRLNAGTGSALEVAQSEAQAASTRVRLTQAQGSVNTARVLLAFLIGAKGEITGPLRDDYRIPADVGSMQALLERGWAGREDLRAARANVEAQQANVQAAIGQYYPSVALNLNGFLFRENFETASKWNALLSINLPIFTGGQIEADVRFAWSRLRQAAMAESLLRRQIEQEIRTRRQDLQTSRASLTEIQAQIRAAAEALRQSRAGFDAGTAITLDVLNAQDVLLQAQLEWTNEEFNEKFQYLQLLRAMGSLTFAEVRGATSQPTTAPTTQPVRATP